MSATMDWVTTAAHPEGCVPAGPVESERRERGGGQVFDGVDVLALDSDRQDGRQAGRVDGHDEDGEEPPAAQHQAACRRHWVTHSAWTDTSTHHGTL